MTWSPSATSLDSDGLFITNGALITNPNVTISSVSIDPASTGLGAFNISDVTFNANNVATDWQHQTFAAGSTIILDLNTSAVPEPAAWTMMLVGFGALGGALRRRKATAATA